MSSTGNRSRLLALAVLAAVFPLVAGCTATRPVLYPNAKYEQVGSETAQRDIDYCLSIASHHTGGGAGETAEAMATNAGVGAAGGAAGRAAGGGSAGRGAAAGAASAAARTLFRAILRPHGPSAAYRRLAERCLRERGYEPMGWR